MKIRLKKDLFRVIKISGITFLVSCGSNGSKSSHPGLNPSGILPHGGDSGDANPDEDGDGAQGDGDQGVEGDGDQDQSSSDGDPANNPGGDGSMDPNMPTDGSPSKEPDIQKIFPKTGIRNFSQINATMSTLTGVPTTNAQITAFYNAQATSLPTDNDVKGFIGSQQVAVFKLAVEYCDVLVKDTTLRTSIFGNFNFAAAPNVAFATDAKNALADSLVSKFWGKNLSTLAPHAENVAMVVTLIDDLLNGRDLTVATQTPAIATGTCAGVLSSAPVTLY